MLPFTSSLSSLLFQFCQHPFDCCVLQLNSSHLRPEPSFSLCFLTVFFLCPKQEKHHGKNEPNARCLVQTHREQSSQELGPCWMLPWRGEKITGVEQQPLILVVESDCGLWDLMIISCVGLNYCSFCCTVGCLVGQDVYTSSPMTIVSPILISASLGLPVDKTKWRSVLMRQ
jgi:hypothetical protein